MQQDIQSSRLSLGFDKEVVRIIQHLVFPFSILASQSLFMIPQDIDRSLTLHTNYHNVTLEMNQSGRGISEMVHD